MKKFLVILSIFLFDRLSKIYLIGIQESGSDVNIYISAYLNFFLVWNTGIGFGLISTDPGIYYHLITLLIALVNIFLIYILIKLKNVQSYLIALILGGSIGNLFDRIYYFAVPDFIDFHIDNFHWFTFNVADIFITTGILGLILFEILNSKKINKNV